MSPDPKPASRTQNSHLWLLIYVKLPGSGALQSAPPAALQPCWTQLARDLRSPLLSLDLEASSRCPAPRCSTAGPSSASSGRFLPSLQPGSGWESSRISFPNGTRYMWCPSHPPSSGWENRRFQPPLFIFSSPKGWGSPDSFLHFSVKSGFACAAFYKNFRFTFTSPVSSSCQEKVWAAGEPEMKGTRDKVLPVS